MIQRMTIANVATFGTQPQVIDDLKQVNFFYGANGAGKTTISRAIDSNNGNNEEFRDCSILWQNGNPLETFIYNRDFIERNFIQSSELSGVFTIGNETIELKNKIEEAKAGIAEKQERIDDLKKTLQGEDGNGGKRQELKSLTDDFTNTCYTSCQTHKTEFSKCFAGFIKPKTNFRDKVLEAYDDKSVQEDIALNELREKAKTLYGGALQKITPLAEIKTTDLIAHEGNSILGKAVIGKQDVDIAKLIEQLGNSDWVKQGREHFDHSKPKCPFCQQDVEDDFVQSLEDYFDDSFTADMDTISSLVEEYERDADEAEQGYGAILTNVPEQLDAQAFRTKFQLLKERISANRTRIAGKKKEPSRKIELKSLSNTVAELDELIKKANAEISRHNNLVNNQATERDVLSGQIWHYIAHVEQAKHISSYREQQAGMETAIKSLEEKIGKTTVERDDLKRQLQGLESQTTSVEPTRKAINHLLEQFGFTSFTVEPASDANSYVLMRPNGREVGNSLSEGEKTFLTFLYFYHMLSGSTDSSGINSPRIVVFDDPISSLDSEILFIVSTLIKGIIRDIRLSSGNIKQAFILTHNVYFHKEVTYIKRRPKEPALSQSFYRVRCKSNSSTIEGCDKNPIKTYYELLWEELKQEPPEVLTIRNTMRRILEHYFKILGGTDLHNLCDRFDGKDKCVCRCLISWLHDGSHNADDDLFMAGSEYDIDTYKRVFEDIFRKQGQDGHYDMMMATENESASS